MERKNKILICIDCHEEFVFTVNAQEYFAEKGITEDPKRCKTCYAIYKAEKRSHAHPLPPPESPIIPAEI